MRVQVPAPLEQEPDSELPLRVPEQEPGLPSGAVPLNEKLLPLTLPEYENEPPVHANVAEQPFWVT